MDMASVEETPAAETLKCRIFCLRVPMHCDGCKRKVKRILQAIDGVYVTSIDMAQDKVTVTGDIRPHVVIQKLAKFGKRAELWPEQRKPKNEEGEKDRKEEKAVGSGTGKGKRVKGGGGKNDRGGGEGREGLVKLPYYPSPTAEYTVSYRVPVHSSNRSGGWAPPVEVHHHHHHLRHSPIAPPRPPSLTPQQQLGYGNSSGAHSYSPASPPPAPEKEWHDMFSDENPNACRVM